MGDEVADHNGLSKSLEHRENMDLVGLIPT
jgi:hypothetical protein